MRSAGAGVADMTGSAWLRLGRFSWLVPLRPVAAALALAILAFAAFDLSILLGSSNLDPLSAILAVFGIGDPKAVFVVQKLRLFRGLAAILAGGALGLAGCLLQTLARNRLATPDTTGVTSGATAFAVWSVISFSFGGAAGPQFGPPVMALFGAALAAGLAFLLSGGAGNRGYRFIVVGIAIGEIFSSLTAFFLARVDMDTANAAYTWTVGSLNLRGAGPVFLLAIGLAIALPAGLVLARQLGIMRLDDPVARSLGIRVTLIRAAAILLAVLLGALAVSLAGPVGMVGLLAPEIARRLAGARAVPVFGSMLAGALVLLCADLLGRTAFSPIEIPVGLVTSAVGAPYLLFILLRSSGGSNP